MGVGGWVGVQGPAGRIGRAVGVAVAVIEPLDVAESPEIAAMRGDGAALDTAPAQPPGTLAATAEATRMNTTTTARSRCRCLAGKTRLKPIPNEPPKPAAV